jgi:hypothetical protein
MPILQGTVNKNYISSIDLMDERVILDQVLDTTSEDATIVDILDMTGRMVQTDQIKYSHFTNDYTFRSGTIAAIDAVNNGEAVAGPVNEPISFTLSSDEELPIQGELALFQNKRQGRVSTINPSTRVVTVKPFSNAIADTLSPAGNSISISQKVSFFSGAYGEGSDDPASKKPTFKRSENQVQIFKTAREITDVQKVSTIEVKYDGKKFILYKMQHDALLEHRAKIAFHFLVGKKGTMLDEEGNTVWTTQGIRQNILHGDGTVMTSGGVDVPLTSTISLTNLRTMSRALDKRGAGLEYWLWCGGDLCADLDDVLSSLGNLTAGGILYNSWGKGDAKQKAIDLGVDSFSLYGRTFHKKLLKAYDHPEVFALNANFDYSYEGYLIPGGKTKIDHSGATIDAIRTRYMSNDGTDFGKWNETLTGKLAPVPTNTKSVLHIGYQSIMGLECSGIRQFGIFSKA